MIMLECLNGKERDIDDWTNLFQAADPRFVFQSARRPTGSFVGIIEAVWIP